RRPEISGRVISLIVDIGKMEMKGWQALIGALTPLDCRGNDVDAVVTSAAQISCQRPGHTSGAAADIQHSRVRFEAGDVCEIAKEFFTAFIEVVAPHAVKPDGGN